MKTKVVLFSIYIFVIAIIQTTVLEYIRIFHVKPNLLLVLTVVAGLLEGSVEGAVIGFFTGLAQDIATGKLIGFYALLGMYIGLIAGFINKRLYRENFFVVMFFTFLSTVVYEIAVYFLSAFLKGQMQLLYAFRYIILPEGIYNCIMSVFMFILIVKVKDKVENMGKSVRKY